MATPRGITQPHTSFIGSACQGIHHTPVTKHTDTQTIKVQTPKHKKERYSRPLYSSHTTQPPHKPSGNDRRRLATRGPTRTHNNLCCPRHPTVHQCITSSVTRRACITHPTPHSRHPPLSSQPHDHRRSCTNHHTMRVHPAKHISWQSLTRRHQPHKNKPTTVSPQKLLRKEVIQPPLPVRLPCYDFVPIADPTFDSSL